MKKGIFARLMIVIAFGIISVFCVVEFDSVKSLFSYINGVLFPIFLGLGMAFVINIPMNSYEKLIYKIKKKPPTQKSKMRIRLLSLLLAFISVLAIIAFVMLLVVPEFVSSLSGLFDTLSDLPARIQEKRYIFDKISPKLSEKIFEFDKEKAMEMAVNFATKGSGIAVGLVFNVVASVFSAIINILIAVFITFNLLMQKELISAQIKKILFANLKAKYAKSLIMSLKTISQTFANFITGQCVEACILGSIFFILMTIIGFPYALVISVFISFTALIPVFGAFIGCILGAILIVIESFPKAIAFVIMFLIIQQLENNFIYPRVVGGSVGLPALWTFVSVMVGGSMFGLMGMIFFIPVFSVVYTALRKYVYKRIPKDKPPKDENKSPDETDLKEIPS